MESIALSDSAPAEPSARESITLLDLPPEIRMIIWEYAFQDTRITLKKPSSAVALDIFPAASLLLLHSSIRGETQQVFWECAMLAIPFGDWKALRLLNQRPRRENVAVLHNLCLSFYPFWDSVPRDEMTAFWSELCLLRIRRIYFKAWVSYQRLPGRGLELSSTKSLFRAFARITGNLPPVEVFVLELRMNSESLDDVCKIESIAKEEEHCRQAIDGAITFVGFENNATADLPKSTAEAPGTVALFQWMAKPSRDVGVQ